MHGSLPSSSVRIGSKSGSHGCFASAACGLRRTGAGACVHVSCTRQTPSMYYSPSPIACPIAMAPFAQPLRRAQIDLPKMRANGRCTESASVMSAAFLHAAPRLVNCVTLKDWIRMAWTSRASAWMQNRHQLREIAASRRPYHVPNTAIAEQPQRVWNDGTIDCCMFGNDESAERSRNSSELNLSSASAR